MERVISIAHSMVDKYIIGCIRQEVSNLVKIASIEDSAAEEMQLSNLLSRYFADSTEEYQLDDRLNADEVAEIKRLISAYDTTVETGNEAVNVVLAEKIMLCEKAKICFEYMVDGQSLSFMNQAELYALFGNILDNAIEAVRKLPEDADRYIDLKVSRKMGMILVHCENAYSGALQFEDALPITTKTDKRYHGYGLRSVRLLVERYNGSMKIHTSGNVFALDILLTIKQ